MPGPLQDTLVRPSTPVVEVVLDQVHSVIHSLMLLTKLDHTSGLDTWVVQTAGNLPPEVLYRNKLVIVGFYYSIEPQQVWTSFPAYLDYLAKRDARELRDQMLHKYAQISRDCSLPLEAQEPAAVDWEHVLSSSASYLVFLREHFGEGNFDEALETEAFGYLNDPSTMQELIVSHLRHMWSKYLEPEWTRVEPMLQDAVAAFRQIDLDQMSRFEAAELVTGQRLEREKWENWLDVAERVVFVPTPHIGPYLGRFQAGNACGVLFGARLPTGVDFNAPDLSRAEILVRLNALADDSRLRIVRLVSEEGELRSQEIIDQLDLSQSAASRHLKQLTATGFLRERRCQGAKCYRLDPERVEDTLGAIRSFLVRNAPDE